MSLGATVFPATPDLTSFFFFLPLNTSLEYDLNGRGALITPSGQSGVQKGLGTGAEGSPARMEVGVHLFCTSAGLRGGWGCGGDQGGQKPCPLELSGGETNPAEQIQVLLCGSGRLPPLQRCASQRPPVWGAGGFLHMEGKVEQQPGRQAEGTPERWQSWAGRSFTCAMALVWHRLAPWGLLSPGPGHGSAPSSPGRLSTASADALCLPRTVSLLRSPCSPCKPYPSPCASPSPPATLGASSPAPVASLICKIVFLNGQSHLCLEPFKSISCMLPSTHPPQTLPSKQKSRNISIFCFSSRFGNQTQKQSVSSKAKHH